MNSNDVKDSEVIPENIMKAIFKKQKELALTYHSIESNNGLLQTEDFPVCLDDPRGQQRLKDFAWRITEELGEAHESLGALCGETSDHFREELMDALHFLVELLLNIGLTHEDVPSFPHEHVSKTDLCAEKDKRMSEFITALAVSMNCLKNKPWKMTNMRTDRIYFIFHIRITFVKFFYILADAGITEKMMYQYYFKKHAVNKFRQRSNY